MNIVKIISTEVNEFKQRVSKFLRFGLSDIQTAVNVSQHGIDSNPIKDMIAIYATTTDKGSPVIVGYINVNNLADTGELRLYATDNNGSEQIYLWLKKDGTIEMAGDSDFMVRFSELKTGFDNLKSDLNSHITEWNTFAAAYVPGGPAVLGLPPTASTSTSSTASIDNSKIDEIKTI